MKKATNQYSIDRYQFDKILIGKTFSEARKTYQQTATPSISITSLETVKTLFAIIALCSVTFHSGRKNQKFILYHDNSRQNEMETMKLQLFGN